MKSCSCGNHFWVFLLKLSLILTSLTSVRCIVAKTSSAFVGAKNSKIQSTAVASFSEVYLAECCLLCKDRTGCESFHYNEKEKACELIESRSLDSLVASPDWNVYILYDNPTPEILDPCASSPCSSGSVCVSYHPLTGVPFNPQRNLLYNVPGHVCMSLPVLLDDYNLGKTKCWLEIIAGTDFPGYDISFKHQSYWLALEECSGVVNCKAVLCVFTAQSTERCHLKNSFPDQYIETPPFDKVVAWYPKCIFP